MSKKRGAIEGAGPGGGKGGKKKPQGQTRGQSERDPKSRTGHYTGAGEAPLMKK